MKVSTTNVVDCRTGQTVATVSQVNAGIIRKDLARIGESRAALKKLTVAQLIKICAEAGRQFLEGTLLQTPREYMETLSATSGLPHVMVRRNMAKIHQALTNMETVLGGLTRGLDLSLFDRGFDERLSFYPPSKCLGLRNK